MSLTSVEDALKSILDGATPLRAEDVPLREADGRFLAADLAARRTQPPADMSAMDGYAVRQADLAALPATLAVVGEAAAGHPYDKSLEPGQAVRILTGAPVPAGADTIVIQENCARDGDAIAVSEPQAAGRFIRRAGLDFSAGDVLLPAGTALNPRLLALAAAMGHGGLPVHRRPVVAILSTGDELVEAGSEAGDSQIIASNAHGVAAMVARAGGEPLDLGIARDDQQAIAERIAFARGRRADILVTLGGASVGDHDLVGPALADLGMKLGFWKIAMRPGKPLMSGRLGDMRVLGLPGNPVSSIVCTRVFVLPLVAALAGDDPGRYLDTRVAVLGRDLAENDRRQDYLRATLETVDGRMVATPFPAQDSSMLATLSRAAALVIRAPFEPAAKAGSACRIMLLDA
ncbi:MAG: gephyrin-like molybdotransferase Glp [Flavobacteriaceae bacterium]